MSSKAARIVQQEKDDTGSVFIEKNFADYKSVQNTSFAQPSSPSRTAPVSRSFETTLEKQALPYFKDLIALESILEKFAKSLTVFLSRSEEHCAFNLWSGRTLTGKTTLAKRFSGLEGYPVFTAGGSKAYYYDCFSIKDAFENIKKDWVDKAKLPNNSIVFIDEIEKCLDEKHKLVDEAFAKKFRKYLEDLSRTRKIFFVFLTNENATRENIQRLFDVKLTSLTDFEAKFPEWTTENLLHIILESVNTRGYTISSTAAASLALHANQHGMVLEMQGVLQLLEVELRRTGERDITEKMMEEILQGRR